MFQFEGPYKIAMRSKRPISCTILTSSSTLLLIYFAPFLSCLYCHLDSDQSGEVKQKRDKENINFLTLLWTLKNTFAMQDKQLRTA